MHSKYVIGPFEGDEPLKALRMWEDKILTAGSLGLMHRCYKNALSYAKSHKSGNKPIIAYQEVGFKLAEMLTLLQTAQLLAYRAAWMAETNNKEANVGARCAKVFLHRGSRRSSKSSPANFGGIWLYRWKSCRRGLSKCKISSDSRHVHRDIPHEDRR